MAAPQVLKVHWPEVSISSKRDYKIRTIRIVGFCALGHRVYIRTKL
jgi:hypothetical protein